MDSPTPSYKTNAGRIIRSSAWLSVYRILRMVIAFAVGIIVARYLGPEDYGRLHYALASVLIFMGVAGPGIKDVITRRFDANESETGSIINAGMLLIFISNMLMLSAALLMVITLRPGDELILMMAAVIGVGNLFRVLEIYELWFHYKLEMGKTVLVQGLSFFLISAGKIGFVLLGMEVFWFAILMGSELVLTGIGFIILIKIRPQGVVRSGERSISQLAVSIFRESIPSIAGVAFVLVLFKIDQVMLGWLSSDAEVGFYAVAVPFSEYWAFLAIAIVTSAYPALLEAFRKSDGSFDIYFKRTAGILGWLAIAIMIPVWFLGEWVILLFLGDVYAPSANILSIHIWSLYFIFMIELMRKWYVIQKKLHLFLYISGLAALINVLVNYALIPAMGGIGAAWATIIAYSFAGYWGLLLFRDTRKKLIILPASFFTALSYLKIMLTESRK